MKFSQACLERFPSIIPFKFPGIPEVSVFFTTGLYGNISLETALAGANEQGRRAALAPLLGFDGWTELRQVHGDTLLVEPQITGFDEPSRLEADGTATSVPRQALLSKAADCQQIMLAHISGRYVAALHCGWRGNAVNFPARGLAAFCRAYNIRPGEVMAARGPSLGPGAAEFVNFASEWPEEYRPWFSSSTKLMDLWGLTRSQLVKAGVPHANIFGIDLCTYTFSDLFFSYRRRHEGRQGAIIFIES